MRQDDLKDDWDKADAETPLPANLSEGMYRQIEAELFNKKKRLTLRKSLWSAVAATVLLFITIGIFKRNNSKPAMIASLPKRTKNLVQWEEKRNDTNTKEIITLPDGTVVQLFKHSAIRFKQPFVQLKREIVLEGHASFNVSKNQKNPFVVYAGPTATTVLGTSFNVAQNAGDITVKLYSGKVMVKPAGQPSANWKKAIYLSPGQQMKYNVEKGVVAVTVFKTDTIQHIESMTFSNSPIQLVLDSLAAKYHVQILYDARELDKIYFTGTIQPTDSLMEILQSMGNMNKLAIAEQNNTIIIKGPQH
ncbi:FecR family protein [Chitinophaga sp. CF118]|uniref:FecR family protein n=1 Tax=Chitinophaga sp. CF118 TaxID=1884367 RepID=UPI0008F33552|nr:FecR family protein [Chitinophaga sp. CF118]SFE41919.1 FecR family protein [Chitinophaga sp. CF118]